MVVRCEIQFTQNSHGIYLAGQYISGTITLISDKPKNVKSVLLKVVGFAHTSWEESKTDFSGHEEYIASTTCLLGADEDQSVVIEPGIHSFNFGCNLPKTCPSSFEGAHGRIRYTVNVVLIRPWKFDQTFMKAFTVMRVVDLNYDSPLGLSADDEVQTTFCCYPCRTEAIKLHLTLPQSGYVSGQDIPVCLIVTNDSNVYVQEIKVSLVLLVCYYCDGGIDTETERMVVSKLNGEPVQKYCKKLFNYLLHVPATPATSMNHCRLIRIAYQVEAEAKIKGLHANQVLCMPVTIGNVPLSSVILQQPTSSVNRHLEDVPPQEDVTSKGDVPDRTSSNEKTSSALSMPAELPWAADANIPPPSYEKAAHMITLKLNTSEPLDFAPMYPVFQTISPVLPASVEIADNSWKHSARME